MKRPVPSERLVAAQQRQIVAQQRQIVAQQQRIAELTNELKQAQRQVAELRARLEKNSTNSSKPPSSDPLHNPRRKRRARRRSKRKRGAQPGHPKHERALVPVEQVTSVTPVKPSQCRQCGDSLTGDDCSPHRHQVWEVPRVEPTITEYQLHRLRCTKCGTSTRAALPEGVPQGCVGPRLQAVVAMASGMYRLPKRLVQTLLSDLYGVTLSLGCISNVENRTSGVLAKPAAQAHEHVKQPGVLYADETGWRERGHKVWLWMAATATVAVFLIQPRRTMEMAKHLIGADFAGWLVTDRCGSYGFVDTSRRQLCWAHLLRDIEAFRLCGHGGKQLATQLQRPARKLIRLNHRVRDGTLTWPAFQRSATPLRQEILFHLRRGAMWRQRAIAGVCSQILKLKDALFSFVDHKGIAPTNNHAERLLRHAVIWRKTSFGTDSATGSRFVERMLTVVATLRLQHRNVLDYVTDACRASLNHHPPPSLLPTPPPDSSHLPLAA